LTAKAITIAGSDSGGGAGIQADLKTFCAFGVYGTSAITALTAQNTRGVQGTFPVPPDFVRQQLIAILEDIPIDAGKTGMLANAGIIHAVADVLGERPVEKLVVDPVMISKHGAPLLENEATDALIGEIIPLAYVLTPNINEAMHLTKMEIHTRQDMADAAIKIHAMGPKLVLIKGGHLDEDQALDVLYDGNDFTEYPAPRIDTPHTHGTGCTLSAAIAANLALGLPAKEAIREAKAFIISAIKHTEMIGSGISPVNHLWSIRRP